VDIAKATAALSSCKASLEDSFPALAAPPSVDSPLSSYDVLVKRVMTALAEGPVGEFAEAVVKLVELSKWSTLCKEESLPLQKQLLKEAISIAGSYPRLNQQTTLLKEHLAAVRARLATVPPLRPPAGQLDPSPS
jgi:hypothetical protein